MNAAIRTVDLGKDYRAGFWMSRRTALDGLSLEVPAGETFGFIGPNGAGKTTTIKILMGLQAASRGSATIFGLPHTDPESRRRVGFLPERPYFYEHLTARELLDFYGLLLGLSSVDRQRRGQILLERLELGRYSEVPLGRYSKGMLQRVGLCQALLNEPELVVLDEPMSGLDPIGRALVRRIIQEERTAGRTVFFSSHILPDIEALCDRVAMVVDGRLRGVGRPQELVGDRVRWVELTAAGPLAGLRGELIRTADGHYLYKLDPQDSELGLEAARSAGVRVISLHPIREGLEAVLLDEVERARPVDVQKLGVLT
jgi:ABC-2 type transport system ATP-binding protein